MTFSFLSQLIKIAILACYSLFVSMNYTVNHAITSCIANGARQYLALFWGFGLLLGYLATFSAKSDVRFLLGGSDFL